MSNNSNPGMVFYCLKSLLRKGEYPENTIDRNIRVNYGKLRHFVALDTRLNGNFTRLESIAETGGIRFEVINSFSAHGRAFGGLRTALGCSHIYGMFPNNRRVARVTHNIEGA